MHERFCSKKSYFKQALEATVMHSRNMGSNFALTLREWNDVIFFYKKKTKKKHLEIFLK